MTAVVERYSEYDRFAWVYNQHWGVNFAQRIFPVIERLALKDLPERAEVLDLCCGTGQLAHQLAERGYRVTGLDGSVEMLEFARQNAPGAVFLVEDARSFQLPSMYHAAVSTYDSLNHIMSLEELEAVFSNVYTSLRPGGRFVFDLNMEEGLKPRWNGTFSIVEDDHVCVVQASYRPEEKLGETRITIFREETHWQRSDLSLVQRCYSEQEIRAALEAAGFVEISSYDAQNDFGLPGVGRMVFACRRAQPRAQPGFEWDVEARSIRLVFTGDRQE